MNEEHVVHAVTFLNANRDGVLAGMNKEQVGCEQM
jgi:hypothetical protein